MTETCRCGHRADDHFLGQYCTKPPRFGNGVNTNCLCSAPRPADDLTVRLVRAVVEELREEDKVVIIGIGKNEIKLTWETDRE